MRCGNIPLAVGVEVENSLWRSSGPNQRFRPQLYPLSLAILTKHRQPRLKAKLIPFQIPWYFGHGLGGVIFKLRQERLSVRFDRI